MKLDPRVDNLLSERDGKRHAKLRAKLMPGVCFELSSSALLPRNIVDCHQYTGKDIPSLESDIDARVMDLVNLVKREYSAKVLDFALLAGYFTLDALTEMAFGHPFGFLSKNEDVYDYIKTSCAFYPVMELGCNIPFINSIMTSRFMYMLAGPKPEDKVGMGAVIGVAQKVVAERYGNDAKSRPDMLNSFVTHGLTQQEAESETVLQLIAGADSTATTIRCTFLYLLTNPSVYAKLVSEIDAAIAEGLISFPVIKDSEARQLPYLQACIMEGLRIWPPLNGIADRIAPRQGQTIDGKFIPGGTRVAFNVYRLMRRTDIWGDDANIFRPGRWIEADPETRYRYDKIWELSFGYGRYSCLGKNIAWMELNKVFVEVSPSKARTSCSYY